MTLPEGPLYRPLVWSLSLFLFAAGVLLMIEMVSSVIGPFRIADLGRDDPRARLGLWGEAPGGARVPPRIARLRAWLPDVAELRGVVSLQDLDPGRVGTVLLSDPRALGAAEVAALERYLAAGGGAVVTGSLGVRDADGTWRGYDLMRHLLGGVAVAPLPADRTAALEAAQRGPLSAPLHPGQRLAVQPQAGLPALPAADRAELRWSASSPDGAPGPAASLRRSLGRGRLVWLAVGPERGEPGEAGERPLAAVLASALAWVARRPEVEILPWPDGAPFAATIAHEGEDAAGDEAALEPAIASARRRGGLARLALAPGADSYRRLDAWLATLEGGRAWVATHSELSAWVRQRSALEAGLRPAGPRRLRVEITNHAPQPARHVVLRLHLNEPTRRVDVEPTALLQARPVLRFRSGEDTLDLVLPELAARRSAAFTVDHEPVDED